MSSRPIDFDEPVHGFPPCPEVIADGGADLCQARHSTLKCMAMDVGKAGQADRVAFGCLVGRHTRSDGLDSARGRCRFEPARPSLPAAATIETTSSVICLKILRAARRG